MSAVSFSIEEERRLLTMLLRAIKGIKLTDEDIKIARELIAWLERF